MKYFNKQDVKYVISNNNMNVYAYKDTAGNLPKYNMISLWILWELKNLKDYAYLKIEMIFNTLTNQDSLISAKMYDCYGNVTERVTLQLMCIPNKGTKT